MQEGTASFTASLVTLSRAAAHRGGTRVKGFSDPAALELLQGPLLTLERLLALGGPATRLALRAASLLLRGATDVVPLRTRAIDAALLAAVGRGVDRLVILGAGFDGRAFRLPELSPVTVREVDHPATQAFKQAQLQSLRCLARELLLVPVDFARDDLGEALLRSGHEPTRPTFWIWEGVTMYLPPALTAATLATVRRLSAPGSQLAVTYIDPHTHRPGLVTTPLRWLVRQKGEPFLGLLRPEQMASLLGEAGLRGIEDTSATDWARAFGDFPAFVDIPPWERMALAGV